MENIKSMNSSSDVSKIRRRFRIKRNIITVARHFIICLLGVVFLLPVFVMLTRSVMTADDIYLVPTKLFPSELRLQNFADALDSDMLRYIANTGIVLAINVVFVPLTCLLCAYGFAKVEFKGKNVIFAVVLSTIMIPGIAMQIPLYIMYYNLKFLNSLLPLTLPAFFGGGAMNIFFMRQYIKGIPNNMVESARVDGANTFVIMMRIMLPLCIPVVTLTAVNTFIGQYNDYGTPLIYIWNDRYYTLAIGLYYKFLAPGAKKVDINIQYATGVFVMLPMVLVFAIFQKQLINGIITDGMKL